MRGFVPKDSKSYQAMVEFTQMLTQPKLEAEEKKIDLQQPDVKESSPDCACVCHPKVSDTQLSLETDSCDDGEGKASSVALMENNDLNESFTLLEVEEGMTKNNDEFNKESEAPGLQTDDIQLLSAASEPLEDRNEKDKIKEEAHHDNRLSSKLRAVFGFCIAADIEGKDDYLKEPNDTQEASVQNSQDQEAYLQNDASVVSFYDDEYDQKVLLEPGIDAASHPDSERWHTHRAPRDTGKRNESNEAITISSSNHTDVVINSLEHQNENDEMSEEEWEVESQEAAIVLIPQPPHPQVAPIVLLPRPLSHERECQCFMRRLKREDIPNTPLLTIDEVYPEISQATIGKNKQISFEQISENSTEELLNNEPAQEETRKCAENCVCSCHQRNSGSHQDVHFEPGVLPLVEPDQHPQPKCIELCVVHCPRTSRKDSSHIPLVNARDSIIVASKRISSNSEKEKDESRIEHGRKSEGASSLKSESKPGFIKRLSNSLRRSK